jgi:SIR2-like domain
MIWKGHERRTVFILGAGATRGALGHVVINRKRLKPPLNGDFFRVAKTFVSAHAESSGLRGRYAKLRAALKDEFRLKGDPQMEEAFSLLYVSKDFPGVCGSGQGRKPKPGTRREIADFLTITFGMLSALDGTKARINLYDHLAASVGPQDSIITLNYDTTLDSALVRAGWDPSAGYGLMGGKDKVKWRVPKAGLSERMSSVRLLKLHGSVNWFVRGTYGRLSRVFDNKPSMVTKPRHNECAGHIRQIVPPIFGKFFGHKHWGHLWLQAFKALCKADVIVVVGCSLIHTDFHLRALVQRAATVRKKNGSKFQGGIFVDKVTVRRRWQKALTGAIRQAEAFADFASFSERHLRGTSNGQAE